ncbi:MAG: D-alanine--D-alanine ligase [Firmicutes bacterium]|nr:D-alanine--D-alanine ligase [Bacillota bacterium]
MPRVIVMMGGPSSEHEVSLASGRMVAAALPRDRYDVAVIVIGRDGRWVLKAPEELAALEPHPVEGAMVPAHPSETLAGMQELGRADCVFLAFHGKFGEDGTLQGMLETLGIPYTGSGPLASALAMHKDKAKDILRLNGLLVPEGRGVTVEEVRADLPGTVSGLLAAVGIPAVVKPNQGGSSLGVSLVETRDQLQAALREAARQDAYLLVEEKVEGTELTCPVLENEEGVPEALPVIEIVPHRGAFFDFASKYESGGADEIVPARIADEVKDACQKAALTAHRAFGCAGFSRTDMIWTERGPVVLEINTIPGMTPNSLLPRSARAAGIEFSALVDRLVRLALRRAERERKL